MLSYCDYMNKNFESAGDSDVSPPVWNLRALSFIPLFYVSPLLFFCLVLSLFLCYPFLLLAHSPDLFFPKSPFSESHSFVWLLFCFFERLGDKYFSWRYVQYMLPYGIGIYIAFMHLYGRPIFNLRLFLSILFIICLIWY